MSWETAGINKTKITQKIICNKCKQEIPPARRSDGAIDFPFRLSEHACKKRVR